MTRRWTRRPEESTWGDWGEDDQLGRLNLIDDAKRRQAAAEVQAGKAFCLSLPLDKPGGNLLNKRRHPPVLKPTSLDDRPFFNAHFAEPGEGPTDVVCDDLAILHLQYSTQWDALAHVGSWFDADEDGTPEKRYYNGFTEADMQVSADGASRATRLGIEGMAAHGVQGRGVMADLRAHLGDAQQAVGYDALMRVLEADGAEVEPGDILCLHTGFADRVMAHQGEVTKELLHGTCSALDGRDEKLQRWVIDSGVAALAADNYAVEAYPARPGEDACCAALPLHELCLFKLGVHLGELWWMTELAGWLRANKRTRFMLTAPPLRLPGAVGSPLSPIATV
ncbi:cyclase family protein [Rhodovulum sp. DZ06]|uniref:cyclase family protein n=1 Tax=Rhodovulum sp. DZ06 TaxID=3425126 RepID=UPI003D34C371